MFFFAVALAASCACQGSNNTKDHTCADACGAHTTRRGLVSGFDGVGRLAAILDEVTRTSAKREVGGGSCWLEMHVY